VASVLDTLGEQGLTLENFSSITSQQMGGWTQVGAHGTGITLPTVDDMVEELTLCTPRGDVHQIPRAHPWFNFARVGLGYLGAVTSLTMHTVPAFKLRENVQVMSHAQVRQTHMERLRKYRHVRYMWMPLTKQCVVVTCGPVGDDDDDDDSRNDNDRDDNSDSRSVDGDLSALKALEQRLCKRSKNGDSSSSTNSFSVVRENILRHDVLNTDHVRQLNEAEAEFWRSVKGRQGPSNDLLGFECGGQQLVLEMCFRVRTPCEDVDYVLDLLQRIEDENIPAPAPIEQRWSAPSTSVLSPSHSTNQEDDYFSWIGIIMYLCDDEKRAHITDAFQRYAQLHAAVGREHVAVPHWAKLDFGLEWRPFLWHRYGTSLQDFDAIRAECDPNQVLGRPPWV